MVFGFHRKSKSNKEIARQDVMVTEQGPIELYRRDANGDTRRVPAQTVRQLQQEFSGPREPYSHRYRPIHTAHGPGLYRNHQLVRGDTIEMQKFNRRYIYHRKAFDWYNSQRYNLIDDIEEILEPTRNTYEISRNQELQFPKHEYGYRSGYNHYDYDPNENYSNRKRVPKKKCCESDSKQVDADDDTVYIVKKKEAPKQAYAEPIYSTPQLEYNPPVQKESMAYIVSI
jgi:hypothetical protein